MSKFNKAEFFRNLFVPELRVKYENAEIKALKERISSIKSMVDSPPENIFDTKKEKDEYIKDLKNELKQVESDLKELEDRTTIKEVNFIICKLNEGEAEEIDELVSKKTSEYIEELQESDKTKEITRLKTILDPQGIFSRDIAETDSESNQLMDDKEEVIKLLIEQILISEGKSEEWATEIEDDEVELTERQEEILSIDDRLPPDEQAQKQLELPALRREMLDEKKKAMREERQREREERITQLNSKGYELLIEILYRYKLLTMANRRGAQFYNDLHLMYSVKIADNPIYIKLNGENCLDSYERFFDSIEEVEFARKKYEGFYNWLLTQYNNLQLVRTREDLDRLARSTTFLYDV